MNLREIPGAVGFFVSDMGVVYGADGSKRNTYKNNDGYVTASVLTEKGWRTFGVHRLVALAFLEKDANPDRVEVNHRDLNITNNVPSNLEWVTTQENNIHSELFARDNEYPRLIALRDDIVIGVYKNAWEASSELGVEPITIWDTLKNQSTINGVCFRYRVCSEMIPDKFKVRQDHSNYNRKIKILDLDTKEIVVYSNFSEAAKAHGTRLNHIRDRITSSGELRLLKKRYRVAFEDQEFTHFSYEDIKAARMRGGRNVISYSTKDGSYLITETAKEFIELTGTSKKSVTTSLAKEAMKEVGGWISIYYTPENVAKLKARVSGVQS